MNIKMQTPILRILALFSVLLMVFSIPVYADQLNGTLSLSPSSVTVGYSGTYSASMEPTITPSGGFFVLNAIIPAGYEFIQPASGNLIVSYTMYKKSSSKNQVMIRIYSNNPATNTVNVQYSLDNGATYTTVNNLDRANMVIGATSFEFNNPTPTAAGSIEITLGGTAGPVTTDHVVTIGLASGVLRSPNTPGSYIWNFEAKNSPGGTSYTKSAVVSVNPSLVKNPGFESGTTYWNNWRVSFTTGLPAFEGRKSANIGIDTSSANMQLYQYGITLEPNTRYKLSFAAFSNTGHDMTVNLLKHANPYTDYGLNQNYDLTTGWQEFSTEFTTTGFTRKVSDARLMFWFVPFGEAGDKYYIDNVRLEKVSASSPPAITIPPANQTVKAGQNATFSAVATGTAPLSYQWQKNGTNIPGAMSASYTTPPTNMSDSGSTYRVNVTNPAGSVMSNDAVLIVKISTNIIKNPGFESGTADWNNYGVSFATGLPASEGTKSANIGIHTNYGFNMQLYQYGITLESNTRYKLSFAAFSNTGHDMTVKLFKHGIPYSDYGLNQNYALTTEWKEFSTEFITTGFAKKVSDARLMFWFIPFGKAGDKYYIDNVRLERI